MKNFTLMTIVLLFISGNTMVAQDNDKVKIQVLKDDPYDVPTFEIFLTPFEIAMQQQNLLFVGFGGGFRSSLGSRFVVGGNVFTSFYDMNSNT